MLRKPGSLTSGEIDAVRLVGPSPPATKRGRSGSASVTASAASRASRGGLVVQLVGEVLHAVVGLGDLLGAEGVGGDDVGAGLEVLLVDGADDVGLGQAEQVAVAPDLAVPVGEALAAVVRPRRAGGPGSSCPWRRRSPGCARASSVGEGLGGVGALERGALGLAGTAQGVLRSVIEPQDYAAPVAGPDHFHMVTRSNPTRACRAPGAQERRAAGSEVLGLPRDRDRRRAPSRRPGDGGGVRGLERRGRLRHRGRRPPDRGVGRPGGRGGRPRGVLRLPGQPPARSAPPRTGCAGSPGPRRRCTSPARPAPTGTWCCCAASSRT